MNYDRPVLRGTYTQASKRELRAGGVVERVETGPDLSLHGAATAGELLPSTGLSKAHTRLQRGLETFGAVGFRTTKSIFRKPTRESRSRANQQCFGGAMQSGLSLLRSKCH